MESQKFTSFICVLFLAFCQTACVDSQGGSRLTEASSSPEEISSPAPPEVITEPTAIITLTSLLDILPDQIASLKSYWQMDQGVAIDAVSPEAEAILQLGATLDLGGGAVFDGLSSYLDIGAAPTLAPGTSDFSITAWIKAEESADIYGIIVKNGGNSAIQPGYWISINSDTGVLEVWVSNGTSYIINRLPSTEDLRDGLWHSIVWTWDRDIGASIYVDNRLSAEVLVSNIEDIGSTNNLTLGGDGVSATGSNFQGAIREFSVWERALSPQEITTIYQAQKAYFEDLDDIPLD